MESPIIAKLPRGHRMDRQFGVVYEHAPAHSDDLTQIDGIRTREAVLLNQRGIYLFGQIALWRHREIVEIAGELHLPVSRIVDEGWVEQARHLSQPAPAASVSDLPASILRTVTLLACALLIGFFTIYFFGQRRNQPLTGVLSADITSIRVPAASRLTAVHVKPGQEVFSGQPLLTLEKLEHLAMIESQERIVRRLELDLKRAEAQARIEMEWRSGDLDRGLSEVALQIAQRRSGLIRSNQEQTAAAAVRSHSTGLSISPVSTRSGTIPRAARPAVGGLMFFSGSGQTSPEPASAPTRKPSVRTAMTSGGDVVSDSPAPLADSTEVAENKETVAAIRDPQLDSLISEQQRLTNLKSSLPDTVREAMGVVSLKNQLEEASGQLETMRSVSREVSVTAPVYGVVGQVRYREGDDLPNGEIMLRILHTDRRYITVHLPTRRVNEMQPGHEVELIFPGKQEFRGQVVEIPMLADTTCKSGDTLAAVRIEPVGRLWPMIPVGSQVDVFSLK